MSALPQLLDCRALMAELGVKRATAEAIMRQLPTFHVDGVRKTFVKRADVARYIEDRTVTEGKVRPKERVA